MAIRIYQRLNIQIGHNSIDDYFCNRLRSPLNKQTQVTFVVAFHLQILRDYSIRQNSYEDIESLLTINCIRADQRTDHVMEFIRPSILPILQIVSQGYSSAGFRCKYLELIRSSRLAVTADEITLCKEF